MLEKSGISLTAVSHEMQLYVRRTVKMFSDTSPVREEQAQLVMAHTDRTGSSESDVGLHIVPGCICMASTENHLLHICFSRRIYPTDSLVQFRMHLARCV